MIKTLFFDADGTLYEEQHAKIKAEAKTAELISEKTGLSLEEVYEAYMAAKWYVIYADKKNPDRNNRTEWYQAMLERLNITTLTATQLSDCYWRVVNANIEAYYDLLIALPKFAEKYELFVLTDELPEICEEKLKNLGVCQYFQKVISSAHAGAVKPYKELFDYALKEAGAVAESSMMIGDSPARDILGAKNASWKTALVQRGHHYYKPALQEETPDIFINSYIEFMMQLEET